MLIGQVTVRGLNHAKGMKAIAPLALLLGLPTGMSRQDPCRVGGQHVSRKAGVGRIAQKRTKPRSLPILSDPAAELANMPTDRLLFITQGARPIGYKPETSGNWFRDRCAEAKMP